MLDPRRETLAKIESQSIKEYERLLKAREANEIFYDPDPADIFIFQLEISDRTDSRGNFHSHIQLFTTRERALRHAANNVKQRYLLDNYFLFDDMLAMYDEGKYEDLIEYASTRFMFFQKIVMVRVSA